MLAIARVSGTTRSAAADGVGARRSAAKSASVVSVSWPTALTTGIGLSTIARTTISSLNAHMSSSEPPPRPTIRTSATRFRANQRIARAIAGAASRPCTGTALSRTRVDGERRRITMQMSRSAAPSDEVMTATARGQYGSGRLRSAANRPSAASFFFSSSKRSQSAPRPCGSTSETTIWKRPRTR